MARSILHKTIIMSLTYVFIYVNEHTNNNLCNKNNINIIKSRINVQKNSFVISAFILRNEFPYNIKTVSGYKCFHSKVISLLIAQYPCDFFD